MVIVLMLARAGVPTLVRAVALGFSTLVFGWWAGRADGVAETFGNAFDLMLTFFVIVSVWSVVDGYRSPRPVLNAWVGAGVLLGVVWAAWLAVRQVGGGLIGWAWTVPFTLVLVLLPAIVGGGAGRLLRLSIGVARSHRAATATRESADLDVE